MSLPTGVRAPATITDVVIIYLQGVLPANVTDYAYATVLVNVTVGS